LAGQLAGNAPLILGSQGWKGVAAYRWKCQFNENSKAPAFWNVFPEVNHNETVGWEAPKEFLGHLHVVILRDKKDSPRIARRVDVTKEIMSATAGGVHEFWAEGESALARLFSLIYPGDFTSAYLALLYKIDPTPVKAIDHLKDELAKV
jgi:glucose/mannose-6-phosphate isomerase